MKFISIARLSLITIFVMICATNIWADEQTKAYSTDYYTMEEASKVTIQSEGKTVQPVLWFHGCFSKREADGTSVTCGTPGNVAPEPVLENTPLPVKQGGKLLIRTTVPATNVKVAFRNHSAKYIDSYVINPSPALSTKNPLVWEFTLPSDLKNSDRILVSMDYTNIDYMRFIAEIKK